MHLFKSYNFVFINIRYDDSRSIGLLKITFIYSIYPYDKLLVFILIDLQLPPLSTDIFSIGSEYAYSKFGQMATLHRKFIKLGIF
jgi:hypothetical protein